MTKVRGLQLKKTGGDEQTSRRLHEELERRVYERTLELAKVNERLRLENGERREAEAAHRASEQLYRELVSSLDGIVYKADVESLQVTYISPQVERLLGYEPE